MVFGRPPFLKLSHIITRKSGSAGHSPTLRGTDWLMHEYTADKSGTTQENSTRLDDWVLCKVYKNSKSIGHRNIDAVVSENAEEKKIKSSRKRKQSEKVKDGNNEAIQLSAESSIAISGPSSSSADIDSAVITYPDNPKRLSSESNASCVRASLEQNTVGSSSTGNIIDKAINEEGIDNTASKAANVESSRQISTSSFNAFATLYMPPYQQVHGFAS